MAVAGGEEIKALFIIPLKNYLNRNFRTLLGVEVGVFNRHGAIDCSWANYAHDYFTAFVDIRSHQDWILSITGQQVVQRSVGSGAIVLCSFAMLIVVSSAFSSIQHLFEMHSGFLVA